MAVYLSAYFISTYDTTYISLLFYYLTRKYKVYVQKKVNEFLEMDLTKDSI